jgi:transcription antitermination factor NusG
MSNDTVADEVPAKPRSYWYVVHTYSGYEAKVKVSMDERKRNEITRKEAEIEILKAKDTLSSRDEYALQEAEVAVEQLKSFFEVLVPAEKVVELVKGQRRTSTKIFPGLRSRACWRPGRLPQGLHPSDASRHRICRGHG